MADIEVQTKKSNPWPWILGLLALVIIAWLVYDMMNDDDDIIDDTEDVIDDAGDALDDEGVFLPGEGDNVVYVVFDQTKTVQS